MRTWWITITAMLGVFVLTLFSLDSTFAEVGGAVSWTRNLEPVILKGSQFPLFIGVNGSELFAYAYSNGIWTQIPLQLDDIDESGNYVTGDDILNEGDELVFMAMDVGEKVDVLTWIDDDDSKQYPRYQVAVTNPLNTAEKGYVYLYRSGTLTTTHADYVSWITDTQRIQTVTYTLGLSSEGLIGIDYLSFGNSGVDVLDRSKLKLRYDCTVVGVIELTEEDLEIIYDRTPSVDGPVRTGGGGPTSGMWSYQGMYTTWVSMSLSDLNPYPQYCDLDWILVTYDQLDPTTTGMAPATYYDANTVTGVPVDGVADTIAATPLNAWNQISGGQGSMVKVMDIAMTTGALRNYYLDDSSVNADDTGDQMAFGEAGFKASSPDGEFTMELMEFFLDPNQPVLGGTYRSYFDTPFDVSVFVQIFGATNYVYLPLVNR